MRGNKPTDMEVDGYLLGDYLTTSRYDPTDINAVSNPLNIGYVPIGNSPQETRLSQQNFSNLLSEELALRGVSRQGSLEDRRQRLREYLIVEMDMDCVVQSISRVRKERLPP